MPSGPGARRAILVSTLSVLAGSGVALAGSLVVRVLMARALEPDALGLVLLGIAVVTPVGAIAGLGTNAAMAQKLAELRAGGEETAARRIGGRLCSSSRLPASPPLSSSPSSPVRWRGSSASRESTTSSSRWRPSRSGSLRARPRSASRGVSATRSAARS